VRAEQTWHRLVGLLLIGSLSVAVGVYARHIGAARAAERYGYPPVPADAASHRLLPAVASNYATSYAFLATLPDGKPVAYDPCRPIHYVVRSDHLPSYGLAMIQQAVAQASAATGLEFVDDGLTTEPPDEHRASVQARYGDRWAPVLIAFTDSTETPDLAADVMGRGGSVTVTPAGPSSARYVTGVIVLDQGDFDNELRTNAIGAEVDRASIMHELGHLVGLAHVSDAAQLMNPYEVGQWSYAGGDRDGLALEGQGACHRDT
jgi:hypothetical protein